MTLRQQQILSLIATELTTAQIATSLGLSVPTVETHRRNLLCKSRGAERGGISEGSHAAGADSVNYKLNHTGMNRSVFLLIAGVYSALLAVSMVFIPEASLRNYGVPSVDLSYISVMQFLGLSNAGFAIMALLNRNASSSFSLRTILLAEAVNILAGVVLGVYHVYGLNVPHSSFFMGDSLLRLAFGLGFMYFYNRETKLAQAGAVLA